MKNIKKWVKWIYKNKKWVFSGIGATIITILYTISHGSVNTADTSDTHNNIEINGSVDGDIYQNSVINNNFMTEKENDEEKIIMSESKYLEYLKSNVEGEIVFHYYDDYDGDGECEMFALVGEYIDDNGFYSEENLRGKIWFVNQDGIMEIESEEIAYWSSPHAFSVDDFSFIAFEKFYTTGSVTYIWGVKDKKPYQPNISGKGYGLNINEKNEIQITHSTYDFMLDKKMNLMLGHTWKKYYFYFNGNSFKEYGGIKIDLEDLLNIPGLDSIVDEIYNHSCTIGSIYYRSNGIININISKDSDEDIHYYNITIRYDGKEWYFVPSEFGENYGGGIYLKEFIPSAATYPDKYPY